MFRAWKTTQSLGCIQLQNELIKKKKKIIHSLCSSSLQWQHLHLVLRTAITPKTAHNVLHPSP
jgi:hypothetical protein